MNSLKTRVLSILTAVILLISALPVTAFAADDNPTTATEHVHGSQCAHHDEHTDEEIEDVAPAIELPPEFYCALFGHSMYKVSEQEIEAGGHGYDYCSSIIIIETWNCASCFGNPESRQGETILSPHDWSVGWCGQTCMECDIVQMFHEDGGCWYCS